MARVLHALGGKAIACVQGAACPLRAGAGPKTLLQAGKWLWREGLRQAGLRRACCQERGGVTLMGILAREELPHKDAWTGA